MHRQVACVGDFAQFGDLIGAVDSAGFARLRNRQCRSDHLVRLVPAVTGQRALQHLRRDLGAVAGKTFKLEPAAEKLRRTAFIGDDVSVLVTKHDSPRRRDLRKRQCVRGRAGRHQKYCDFALEKFR